MNINIGVAAIILSMFFKCCVLLCDHLFRVQTRARSSNQTNENSSLGLKKSKGLVKNGFEHLFTFFAHRKTKA